VKKRSNAPPALVVAVCSSLLALAACKQKSNQFVAPPPAKVTVSKPVQRPFTRYLEATGTAAAYNSVDLVARVQGYLQDIDYKDGTEVKQGALLFTIEPLPYLVKLQQAQATTLADQANFVYQDSEYRRQASLGRSDFSSVSTVEAQKAKRDQADATVKSDQTLVQAASINYTYTRIMAPFDGLVTAHLQSVGQVVGASPSTTTLATILQLKPIYVTFTVSEQDVQRIRAGMTERGQTTQGITGRVPVEVGLQGETGTPHRGTLDYIAPLVDASTGTLTARGLFPNTDETLLPGNFVHVRVPIQRIESATMVPDDAVGADQGGSYVLVVNADDIVEQRRVVTGQRDGAMRVIVSGLKPDDNVVTDGLQRATPGVKVDPQPAPKA